jgi:hypothetical protein
MHRHHDFRGQKKNHLDNRFPPVRNEEDDAARGFHRHQHEPQARDQAERESRPRSLKMKPRLDVRLERINVLVNSTRRYAPHLAVNAIDVRKQD